MRVILIAIGMHTNDYIASLTTYPCNSTSICNIDLILLQENVEHHDEKI